MLNTLYKIYQEDEDEIGTIYNFEEDQSYLLFHPLYAAAYYNIGLAYLEVDNDDAARQAFDIAIGLNPKYADPSYEDEGEYEDYIVELHKELQELHEDTIGDDYDSSRYSCNENKSDD